MQEVSQILEWALAKIWKHMRLLGRLVSTLDAVPDAQVHTRELQRHVIQSLSGNLEHLDQPIYLSRGQIPSELLLKIFEYLDPVSLLCVGSVNKHFYQLSKDNIFVSDDSQDSVSSGYCACLIWYKIYSSYSARRSSSWKPKCVDTIAEKLNNTVLEDMQAGYWKNSYINELITGRMYSISLIFNSVKRYSGVPTNMEKAVRISGLTWAITFKDGSGKESVFEPTDISFRHTSLTVFWEGLVWPSVGRLTTVQLHGVMPVLFDKCLLRSKNQPRRRSLICEYDIRDLTKSSEFLGSDRLVKLVHLKPGILLGLWKKNSEIAFVMATLHYHQLIETSTLGSSDSTYEILPHVPIVDDIDPNYGLHGYQLHIDMHSGPRTYLCGSYRGLFCRKDYIKDGFLRLSVIGMKNNKEHAPLVGQVGLFWKTQTFEGNIQNCFMMDVTVLDETEKPFWCFSTPVQLHNPKISEALYDFMGQNVLLRYQDSVGRVKAELVWMKETEEYYIINLVIYLSTEKVNSWFGTNY
ncbi:F-box only protein 15 [Rhinophrynus dorsalis]